MKLTLRTLLAYIDNLLPAQDAEEFEALLSKNEAANNLCNRIRSVMTRPELGAPDVLDKGLHLDPNVTAEYLDNVLSSEESPEYERLCINSDRQLSEVSACHQILTVVQIEPAEVDPAWREKVYTAPERVAAEESVDLGGEPAEQPAPSGFMASLSGILSGASGILGGGQSLKLNLDRKSAAAPPPVEKADPIPVPPEAPAPKQPPIPPEPIVQNAPNSENASNAANPQAALEQYAQMITTPEIEQPEKPRQNILTWLLCLAALAALIILFVVLFLGPKKNGETEIANNDNAAVTEESNSSDSSTEKAAKPSSKDNESEKASTETTPAETTEPPAVPNGDDQTTPEDNNADDSISPIDPDVQQPEGADDLETPAAETDISPDSATETEDNLDSLPEDNTGAIDDDSITPLADNDNNVSDESDDSLNADVAPIDPSDANAPTAEEEKNSANQSLVLFEDDTPQTMVELGKFVKRNGVDPQILAYKAKGGETWQRMSENSIVRSGDTLLAFPDYRPDIMLDKNARLRLVGPARVSISPKSTPEEIHLTLEYGRLILATSAAFTQKIVIKCANLPTTLEINQAAVVTFEVDALRVSDNPCTTPATFYGTISLLNGKANLQNKGVQSPVAAPMLIDCQSGTTNPQGSAPEWRQVASMPVTDLEKRLTGNKPIGITLSEIIDNKTISKELRQTVLISLSMMEQYATLVEDFNKEDRIGIWMDEFIVLQTSILKSQTNAQSVLEELKKRYDNKGERIFEILWKYQNELTAEDMNALISDLRDETLCVRVAAYCLLKSRGVNLGTYKPNDLKKSETTLKALENKYKTGAEL